MSVQHLGSTAVLITLGFASLAVVREGGLLPLPLLQIRRQTQGWWAKVFGSRVAAILWGLDLGLVFTTWLNFSGAWVLAVVTFLSGKPLMGAALFAAYWVGSALPVWVGPLLMESPMQTPELVTTLHEQRPLSRWIHVAGLICLMLILSWWLAAEKTI
jgi:hypothetical protein